MRAVTWDPSLDEFAVSELPVPEPGPQDVLVKVAACGLNPVDTKINLWHAMVGKMPPDWVVGLDVAGVITALGSGVKGWQVGDRVLYHGNMFRPHGGFAEYAVQDARTLIPLPNVPVEVAAATPCAGWTAWRALVDKLRIQEHKTLFIAGGSGGVGSFAVQIARYFGLEKIITTCSSANHGFVRELGATHALDYRDGNVQDQVMELTQGRGVDIALDCVGGDEDILCASVLGFEGQMVELVRTLRPESYQDAFMNGLSFHQLSLGSGHRHGSASRKAMTQAGSALSQLIESGEISVPQLTTISIDEVPKALKTMREQRTVGKLVMKLSSAG